MKLFITLLFLTAFACQAQKHPCTYITTADVQEMRKGLKSNSIFKNSYDQLKVTVDAWLRKPMDVPTPRDAAGGYTHEKHKENYTQMFNAGIIYQLSGEVKYADAVKRAFLLYAQLNPDLPDHPQATSASPGKIFWQALNDANWLVYAGMAYDLVYNHLSVSDRETITEGAFAPIVNYFLTDRKDWFNLIHNHAVWACAGVGIVGYATDNKTYVNAALHGYKTNDKAGFLNHMNLLFSPSGYYNEGPYYTRYASLPFFIFANAINHVQPELKIFQYRDSILAKALGGAFEQTNIDGAFYSYNDALKEKKYTSNELVEAIAIAREAYGKKMQYLPIARAQARVAVSRGGLMIANELIYEKNIPAYYPYKTVEYGDGATGKEGGVSILRSGKGKNLTSLVFKYSTHGLSHGHYDKLNINLYDNGNEIFQDYGAVRFIGIEQKWGGRYLPETKDYAQQTIAHNTITADRKSHFNGKESESEKYSPVKLWSRFTKNIQAVCAKDTQAYAGIQLQRTVYFLQTDTMHKPLIIDFFITRSNSNHSYDLPFNYMGNVISTNFKYDANTKEMKTLGNKNGYEFLWKQAEADVADSSTMFTFLNHDLFYSLSTVCTEKSKRYFTMVGANDPNFNLRDQPSYIISTSGASVAFANVLEVHGNYSSVNEVASGAYSTVKNLEILRDTDDASMIQFMYGSHQIVMAQANEAIQGVHQIKHANRLYSWTGPFAIWYDGKIIE